MTEKLGVVAETDSDDEVAFTFQSIMDSYAKAFEARKRGEPRAFAGVIDHMKTGFPTLSFDAYKKLMVESAYASAMANVVPWDPSRQYGATQAYAQAFLWGKQTFPFALEAGGEVAEQIQGVMEDVEARRDALQSAPGALPGFGAASGEEVTG